MALTLADICVEFVNTIGAPTVWSEVKNSIFFLFLQAESMVTDEQMKYDVRLDYIIGSSYRPCENSCIFSCAVLLSMCFPC